MADHESRPILYLSSSEAWLTPQRSLTIEAIRNVTTMIVLFLINLLNYVDRYAVAGALDNIQNFFNINDAQGGLLQTVFICSYMALAPLFGYLGDRYSRKLMMIMGVTLWSLTTVAGSFVSCDKFWLFVFLRSLVGVGEASYSCVAPTIIADIFRYDMRTAMLAIFNIAIPLGGGLGYIIGAYVPKLFNDEWQWALRVTPGLGVICVILLIILVKEPVRGSADGVQMAGESSWIGDIQHVLKVKSFVLTTLGFTWVAFGLGTLSWWGPIFLQRSYFLANDTADANDKARVSLLFGIVMCGAGIFGVLLGSEVARRYRKINPRADPIVCGLAVLLAIPFLYFVLVLSKSHITLTWVFISIAEVLLCSNWALISDMLMYIVVPTRRATASSMQIFTVHLMGDASSPYIIGEISDYFSGGADDPLSQWISLRNALMLTPFIVVLGGGAFLFAALYIVQDRRRAQMPAANTTTASDNFGLSEREYSTM